HAHADTRARKIFLLFDRPEFEPRAACGVGGGQAAASEFRGAAFEMKTHLFVHAVLERVPAEKVPRVRTQFRGHAAHPSDGRAFSAAVIAAAVRFQLSVSVLSRRRPDGVSV